mgnify:CR=1 FL=1
MDFGSSIKRTVRGAVAPLFFLAVAGYFGWSATQGGHGLKALAEQQELLAQAQHANALARSERGAWARRVSGLKASNLDPDMLDERARAMNSLSDPNDVIVQYGPKEKLF